MPEPISSVLFVAAKEPFNALLKVIDPLVSTGPSTRVQVIRESNTDVSVRVPRPVFVGAAVHLTMRNRILMGEVRECVATDIDHEIRLAVREVY